MTSGKPSFIGVDLMIESSGGGSAKHVLDLFELLSAHGYDVRLIVSLVRADDAFLRRLRDINPAKVISVKLHRSPHPNDIGVVRQLLDTIGVDTKDRVLHAHSTKAGLVGTAILHRYRASIFTPHAYRGMDPTLSWLKRSLIQGVEYLISRPYDRIIAVSLEEQRYAAGIGLKAGQIVFVPNGVDVEAICRECPLRSPAIAPRPFVIGFAGRMVYQKNPITFLKAFQIVHSRLPNVRALLLGDGPMRSQVEAFVKSARLEGVAELRGQVDFIKHMNDMDILVHTSHYESLPYVLLEACAIGLPVLSVRNAGSVAIFGSDAQLIADSCDFTSIAEALCNLATNDANIQSLHRQSVGAKERFSISTMAEAIIGVYEVAARVRQLP